MRCQDKLQFIYVEFGTISYKKKLASLEAKLVGNSADQQTHSLKAVKCRATSIAEKNMMTLGLKEMMNPLQIQSTTTV